MTHPQDTPANPAQVTDAMVKDATTEFLSHKGERPWRVTRRGAELWEDYAPAMRAALTAAIGAGGQAVQIGFISRNDLGNFDPNGSELIDVVLCPKGTLRPENEVAIYTHPAPSGQAVTADIEKQAWECDKWPDWLHAIVDRTNEAADRLDMSSEQAHAYAALSAIAHPIQPGWRKPRLTESMMRAACKAHFGTENIDGVCITVKDADWTFRKAFKRMWRGALSAAPQPKGE